MYVEVHYKPQLLTPDICRKLKIVDINPCCDRISAVLNAIPIKPWVNTINCCDTLSEVELKDRRV